MGKRMEVHKGRQGWRVRQDGVELVTDSLEPPALAMAIEEVTEGVRRQAERVKRPAGKGPLARVWIIGDRRD